MIQIFQKYSTQQKIWTDSKFAVSRCDLWWALGLMMTYMSELMFICGLAKHSFYEGKLQY